jgi:hypothetical protein
MAVTSPVFSNTQLMSLFPNTGEEILKHYDKPLSEEAIPPVHRGVQNMNKSF